MNTMTNFLVQKIFFVKKIIWSAPKRRTQSDSETTSDRKAGRSGGHLGDTVSQRPGLRSHSMFKNDKESIKAYQKYLQD